MLPVSLESVWQERYDIKEKSHNSVILCELVQLFAFPVALAKGRCLAFLKVHK